ncbi:hypothetical protein [Microvirga sp. TS319]|uniref:hypothetical protein n=1 Tax=Microvirga sp. TS319 TaxID=3241165 RepID=UPI00351A5D08
MSIALALLALALSCIGILWIVGVWISQRIHSVWSRPTGGLDPITGPKDRMAIYDTGGPFIPMPEALKTHEEMVAWMTKELPKLTAEAGKP